MKIVNREHIDTLRWDALVSSHPEASFFSYAWYLDAVAEDWCVLVDENYTAGFALPFTKRMGVEILYVPIFSRFSRPFGIIKAEDLVVVKERFKVREFGSSDPIWTTTEELTYQVIEDFETRKLSSQAKRSLKKAEKEQITVSTHADYHTVMHAIFSELEGKFTGVDTERLKALEQLFEAGKKQGKIKVFEVKGSQESGGVVCLYDKRQVLYLKGACPENLKRNGGMYLALQTAIEFASENKVRFDFGGSNVEGVRRFNYNLGGQDRVYYYHPVNEGPFWFHWARKLNRAVRG